MEHRTDRELLQLIRGRFADSGDANWSIRLSVFFFCVPVPGILLYALFENGIPRWPLTGDQWGCAIMPAVSLAMGLFALRFADYVYEFTGDEIICTGRGRVRWRVQIASVTHTEFVCEPDGGRIWRVYVRKEAFAVVIFPELAHHLGQLLQAKEEPPRE